MNRAYGRRALTIFRRRTLLVLLAIGLTLTLGVLLYLWLRPVPMVEHARRIAYAQFRGDADQLFDYMLPEDGDHNGITRSSFRDGFRMLISPRYARFSEVVSEETQSLGAGDEGLCRLNVVSQDGTKFGFVAVPFIADEGLGAYEQPDLFGRLLQSSWLADYAVERKGKPATKLGKWKIFLRKLDEDAPTLRVLGIKGFISHMLVGNSFADLKLITWEEYRRRLVATIKRLEAGMPEQKPAPEPAPTPPPASTG